MTIDTKLISCLKDQGYIWCTYQLCHYILNYCEVQNWKTFFAWFKVQLKVFIIGAKLEILKCNLFSNSNMTWKEQVCLVVPDKRGHFGIVCTTACATSIIAESTFTFLLDYIIRNYVSSNFISKKIILPLNSNYFNKWIYHQLTVKFGIQDTTNIIFFARKQIFSIYYLMRDCFKYPTT